MTSTTLTGLALGLPNWANASDREIYSIEELMGKAEILLQGEGINLRPEAYEAFIRMKQDAYQDGIDIKVASSYRSFERQRAIFEQKFITFTNEGMTPIEAIEEIITYSTIPGTSRHHWGTDADLIDGSKPASGDLLIPENYESGGPFADFKIWMDANSERYGYYLVYTDHPKRRGFKYEPWHYSYAPLSIPMLKQFRRLNLIRILEQEDLLGAEHFTRGFLHTYVTDNIMDINHKLI
ncbi:MAG: hypothetical protein RLZZ241_1637 [Bacteroidota bacterium]